MKLFQHTMSDLDLGYPVTEKHNTKEAYVVLYDQLNRTLFPDWVQHQKPLLIFLESEAYFKAVPHHTHKIVYMMASARHFAHECAREGYPVRYLTGTASFDAMLHDVLEKEPGLTLTYMCPSEWDTRVTFRDVSVRYPGRIKEVSNTFFLADASEWQDRIRSGYRMEFFYREMRKRTGFLMEGDKPVGGEWNYDKENRKKIPGGMRIPETAPFNPDGLTLEITEMVARHFPDHMGDTGLFRLGVTRSQALAAAREFIDNRLTGFGPYEDAMDRDHRVLFHSGLSTYLNNGLLLPAEVCELAEAAWLAGRVSIHSAEGFIRQLIGWREYVKCYYEALMPDIRQTNRMGLSRPLPEVYWTGVSDMTCMRACVTPVLQNGYTHHIPRLMVLSNYSNLTGCDPRELNRWFWLAFTDAYEWVVLPNVLGMATFADGGILASKPYAASGNYINKMSNFCAHCRYDVRKKTGSDACPFNYLYWNFVDEQRAWFEENGRVSFMVRSFDSKDESEKKAIKQSTEHYLQTI